MSPASGRDRWSSNLNPLTEEEREDAVRGVQTVRAILSMRRGRRGGTNRAAVACPHCGAARWQPCLGLATQRELPAIHPARAAALAVRADVLRDDLDTLGEHP